MLNWGYCKIDNALSAEQVAVIRQRVLDPSRRRKTRRGIALQKNTKRPKNVGCCVVSTKGGVFEKLIEQHPDAVQAGPLVEQIVLEALGPNWISNSLIASISLKGGVPPGICIKIRILRRIPEAR